MKYLGVEHLGVKVGEHHLLSDLSFRLYSGEMCALLGPSGAGKSTLIKSMLAMIKIDGSIRLPEEGSPIAYVPQDDALHMGLTVMQALEYACQLRFKTASKAERIQHIEAIALEVGLSERLKLRIHRLSGGQRKRVSVALELLTKPTFMILDEPTSGLDPGMEAQMMQLFASIAKQDKIVLIATHSMQSLTLCNNVMIMMEGFLVFFGPPKLALKWFKVNTFESIFPRLEQATAQKWAGYYAKSRFSQQYAQRVPKKVNDVPKEKKEAVEVEKKAEPVQKKEALSASDILENLRNRKKI